MENNTDYLSQEQVTEEYYKHLILQNTRLLKENGELKEMLQKAEQKRWKPSEGQLYYYVKFTKKDKISSFTWVSDEADVDIYELGNCFKTEQEAQKAAEAIKQYLSTNRF
jgi:DNA-binding PadR family transcriptional regulator